MSNKRMRVWLLAVSGVLMAILSGCSPLKVLNALTPSSSFSKVSGIAYGSDPRQKLDIYQPKSAVPNAPVVVFF